MNEFSKQRRKSLFNEFSESVDSSQAAGANVELVGHSVSLTQEGLLGRPGNEYLNASK